MPRADGQHTARAAALPALLSAMIACVFASPAQADSIPANVPACTPQTDSLKRLIGLDGEVAKYPEHPSAGADRQGGSASSRDLRSQPTTPQVSPGPPREDRSPAAAASAGSDSAAATTSPPPLPKHIAAK